MPLHEICYALATHYHIDHAGLGEELKRVGVSLLVLDVQVDAIPIIKTWTKPEDNYVEIAGEGNVRKLVLLTTPSLWRISVIWPRPRNWESEKGGSWRETSSGRMEGHRVWWSKVACSS